MGKSRSFYGAERLNAFELLHFQIFELHSIGIYDKLVGAGVYLCSGCGTEHFELIGRGRKGQRAVYEDDVLAVGDGKAGFHWGSRRVLVAEAEGVLLTEAWGDGESGGLWVLGVGCWVLVVGIWLVDSGGVRVVVLR